MKRTLAIGLAVVISLSAWACSADQSAQKAESVTVEAAEPETSSDAAAAADTSVTVDKDSAEKGRCRLSRGWHCRYRHL